VRLLRRHVLGDVGAGPFGEIVPSVQAVDAFAGGRQGLLRQVHRIGAHVRDEALLVEGLGRPHRLPGAEPELAIGLLLQRGGDEGRRRPPDHRLLLGRHDDPRAAYQPGPQGLRLDLAEQHHIAVGDQAAGLLVEVLAGGHPLAAQLHQRGGKLLRLVVHPGLQVPVDRRVEGPSLTLPEHQEAHRHRLHPARGEPVCDLLPEQGREGVAVEPVQNTAGFLRPDQHLIDRPGVVERVADGLASDLVEDHSANRHPGLEHLGEVP
jgi:hypothetical protein